MSDYDVALWRYWPDYGFPVHGYVPAESALLAVLALMEQYKLKHVARAAVGLPGGGVQRWEQGISRYTGAAAPLPEGTEVIDEG